MFHTENPKESLPLIVLLGRLVKTFPPLSGILCQEYGKTIWTLYESIANARYFDFSEILTKNLYVFKNAVKFIQYHLILIQSMIKGCGAS